MSNLREPAAPAVIAGSFADYRLIKSRSVLQLVIEIPVEAQAIAFDALGYPMPGVEIAVAVARLNPAALVEQADTSGLNPDALGRDGSSPLGGTTYTAPLTPKARYAAMTPGERAVQRAGMLPQDERFRAWVTERLNASPSGDRYHDDMVSETRAAEYIRHIVCGGASRARIAEDPETMDKFIALETSFLIDVGQMQEPR